MKEIEEREKKEKIFVVVQGNPYKGEFKGQHTQMRGEGRYELNLALNLARHGHPVSILNFRWGDTNKYPLPPNIKLEQTNWEIFGGDCDIYIKTGWEDCKEPMIHRNVHAKVYLHGWFGNPKMSSFFNYYNQHKFLLKNHYMFGLKPSFDGFPQDIYVYVPMPIIEKIKEYPNINSKKVLYANKEGFDGEFLYISIKNLEWMEQHPEYQYTILFFDNIEKTLKEQKLYNIIDRITKIPNVNLVSGGIPHDELINELGKSILLLDLAGLHPLTTEAISMGCIPIFLGNDGVRVHAIIDIGLDPEKQQKFLYNMNDNTSFIEYYNYLRSKIEDQQYDNSYNIFMEGIRDI